MDGDYGVTGGALLTLAMVPWTYGLFGEYERLRSRLPRLSALWLLYLLYGVLGGITFGFRGFYDGAFQATTAESARVLSAHPVEAQALLWFSGPAFPLSLLLLAAALAVTRLSPRWTAVVLAVGAVAFPVSRIPRVEWVGHLADVLLLVACASLAWARWRAATDQPETSTR